MDAIVKWKADHGMKIKLQDRESHMAAPRELVFQMLSAIGKGNLPGATGESSRVIEREGDTIIAEFITPSGRRSYRTVEEVVLYPPERITYRHLDGPLPYAEEEFALEEQDDATVLRYSGEFEYRVIMLPGMGWLIGRLYIKSKYDAVIRDHMESLKSAAEARAARSHVFRRATSP